MAGWWHRLGVRTFGSVEEHGGPGAGVQLWWHVAQAGSVVSAAAVLEVLEPPAATVAAAYRWGIQAMIAGGERGAVAAEAPWIAGAEVPVEVVAGESSRLVDIAVWMELAEPPEGPPVVARWSGLQVMVADGGSVPVEAVMVTFPPGRTWRRLDVQVDEIGVLMVTNTTRRTANQAVLRLPAAR